MPSANEPREKVKMPCRSPAARSGDAIRMSARDGESYADILKAMKAKVDPQSSGAEVLSIRRTRREETLLVLKRGGDVSAFEKALDQAVGQRADVKSLVSKRSLEVRDLDETVRKKEVVAALCIALGRPDLGDQCRLYKHFGGVQTVVVRLTEADTWSLLGLGRLWVGWVRHRIREHVEVAQCFSRHVHNIPLQVCVMEKKRRGRVLSARCHFSCFFYKIYVWPLRGLSPDLVTYTVQSESIRKR